MTKAYHRKGGKAHGKGWYSYSNGVETVHSGYCGATLTYSDVQIVDIEDVPMRGRCKVCWQKTKYDPNKENAK